MQAPVYRNRVQDEGPERVRRSSMDPGPAYRAAAINEEGAQQIARGAFALSEGVQKMADDANIAAVNAAYSEYVARSTDLLYNADSGLMNASGAGAECLGAKVIEAHKKLHGEISGRLKGRQQTLFSDAIAGYDRSTARTAMVQEGKAMAEYRKTEAIKVLDTNSIAWARAPENFSMEAQEDAIRAAAIGIYGDQGEEQNIKNTDAVRSKFVASTALRMAVDDPIKAQEWAAKNEKLMDPSDAEDVKFKLSKAVMPVKAQIVAEDMVKKFGVDGRGAALDYIRTNYSGEEEKMFLENTESLFTDKVQARNDEQAKAFDSIYNMIRGGSSIRDINKAIEGVSWASKATMWQLMDARDAKFKIGKFAEDGSGDGRIKTDRDILVSLWSMSDAGTLIDKAPDWKTFYSLYGGKLSMTDLKAFRSMYKNSAGNDISDPAIKMQQASIFNKYLDQEKITDLKVRGRAIDRYNYEIEIAEKANKNMPISNEASVAIMAKVVANVVVGTTRTWYGRKTDKTVRRFEIPPGAELRGKTWYYPDQVSGKWLPLSFDED